MRKAFSLVGFLLGAVMLTACSSGDWRTASRESAGIAPEPAMQQQAVIEAYAADAFGSSLKQLDLSSGRPLRSALLRVRCRTIIRRPTPRRSPPVVAGQSTPSSRPMGG